MTHTTTIIFASTLLSLNAQSTARTPPDYDFDFATVTALNNPSFQDPDDTTHSHAIGRGSVPYAYRISKLEVTTGQWVEFLNAYSSSASPSPYFDRFGPVLWGAYEDPYFSGPGTHWLLRDAPNAAMLPVGGISWRMAALYCNWLNNDKGSSLDTLTRGAYDTTTWGVKADHHTFTDELTHSPDAKYWIPTFDEQWKAIFYDPNRFGPGAGGWWKNSNRSDEPGISGFPGVGTTSAGVTDPDNPWIAWSIPLGAYPNSQSPWGLLDTSGGAREMNEEALPADQPRERGYHGAAAGEEIFWWLDSPKGSGSRKPWIIDAENGIRIVSAVPSPSGSTVLLFTVFGVGFHRRRRDELCVELQ